MSHPAFTSEPQSITALWLVLIFCPAEGRRLSWLEWLVTNWGSLPTRRRSVIPVLRCSVSCLVICWTESVYRLQVKLRMKKGWHLTRRWRQQPHLALQKFLHVSLLGSTRATSWAWFCWTVASMCVCVCVCDIDVIATVTVLVTSAKEDMFCHCLFVSNFALNFQERLAMAQWTSD